MRAAERAILRVPGIAPNAPKRNLLVLLLYALLLGILASVLGLEGPDTAF